MFAFLPTSVVLLLQLVLATYGQVTLAPPSTFPVASGSTSSSNATSATVSRNSSTTATPTSSAEFPSLSGYSSCVSNCLALGSAAANCTSVVDVNCFCTSGNFTQELVSCVKGSCSTELASAETLAQQFCNIASSSPSLSFPPIPTSSNSSSASSTSPSESSTSPTTTAPPTATSTSAASGRAFRKVNTPLGKFGSMNSVLVLMALGIVLGAIAIE